MELGDGRVLQRPPDALAIAGPDGEAVRIVDLGPPVARGGRARLVVPEHARCGGEAELLYIAAQEDGGGNVLRYRILALAAVKGIGAGNARPVKQGVDAHGVRPGLLDPEMREGGKFLALGKPRVDGDGPCGQAVLVA